MASSRTTNSVNLVNHLVGRQYQACNPRNGLRHIQQRMNTSRSLYGHDLYGHYGCVNALEFSRPGHLLASGGDDRRILLWNINRCMDSNSHTPHMVMENAHNSNVFCLGFNHDSTRILSGGNDEMVLVHDIESKKSLDLFMHDEPVYGVDVNPHNDNLFVTACSDGRVQLFDLRQPATEDPLQIAGYAFSFHAAVFNPQEPRLIATANQKYGLGLWDVRKPGKCVLEYGNSPNRSQTAMSVRFDSTGKKILGLRRRLPPVIFDIESPEIVAEFDHPGYYNSCTMKSCSFGGLNDEFVMSGSDDFNLYVWKVPTDVEERTWVARAHFVLPGHRSIVNQVRFNNELGLIASAGVEKVVKLWSALPFSSDRGSQLAAENASACQNRRLYSRQEYIELVVQSGTDMTHDYSGESIEENKRMIAFFDSLVQRDVEGLTSSDEDGQTDSTRASLTDSDAENLTDSDSVELGLDGSRPRDREDEDRGPRPTIGKLIALRRRQTMRHYRPKKHRKIDPEHVAKTLANARTVITASSSTDDEVTSWDEDEFRDQDGNSSLVFPSTSAAASSTTTSSSSSSSSVTAAVLNSTLNLVPEALKVSPPAPSANKDKVREEILLALQQSDVCECDNASDQEELNAISVASNAITETIGNSIHSPSCSSSAPSSGLSGATPTRENPAVVDTGAVKFKKSSSSTATKKGKLSASRSYRSQ